MQKINKHSLYTSRDYNWSTTKLRRWRCYCSSKICISILMTPQIHSRCSAFISVQFDAVNSLTLRRLRESTGPKPKCRAWCTWLYSTRQYLLDSALCCRDVLMSKSWDDAYSSRRKPTRLLHVYIFYQIVPMFSVLAQIFPYSTLLGSSIVSTRDPCTSERSQTRCFIYYAG